MTCARHRPIGCRRRGPAQSVRGLRIGLWGPLFHTCGSRQHAGPRPSLLASAHPYAQTHHPNPPKRPGGLFGRYWQQAVLAMPGPRQAPGNLVAGTLLEIHILRARKEVDGCVCVPCFLSLFLFSFGFHWSGKLALRLFPIGLAFYLSLRTVSKVCAHLVTMAAAMVVGAKVLRIRGKFWQAAQAAACLGIERVGACFSTSS